MDESRDRHCEHCERASVLSIAELEHGAFVCPYCARASRVAMLPPEVRCPTCRRLLVLDAQERLSGTFSCSYCALAAGARLPEEAICPSCRKELRLNAKECAAGAFTCPTCHHEVQRDLATPPPPAQVVAIPHEVAEELVRQRARRDMVYGAIAFFVGAGLTIGTLLMGEARFIVAYGPIIYGVLRFVRGANRYRAVPRRELPRATAMLRDSDKPTV